MLTKALCLLHLLLGAETAAMLRLSRSIQRFTQVYGIWITIHKGKKDILFFLGMRLTIQKTLLHSNNHFYRFFCICNKFKAISYFFHFKLVGNHAFYINSPRTYHFH